jgi:hypothetical protein
MCSQCHSLQLLRLSSPPSCQQLSPSGAAAKWGWLVRKLHAIAGAGKLLPTPHCSPTTDGGQRPLVFAEGVPLRYPEQSRLSQRQSVQWLGFVGPSYRGRPMFLSSSGLFRSLPNKCPATGADGSQQGANLAGAVQALGSCFLSRLRPVQGYKFGLLTMQLVLLEADTLTATPRCGNHITADHVC